MNYAWVVLFLIASDVVQPLPSVRTPRIEQRSDLDAPFRRAGVVGTTVVYDSRNGQWVTNDARRAMKRFAPASTFKIFNSLAALETGAVPDPQTILKWDGIPRWSPAWNRDMDMREAMRVSAVWYYQELARRIGRVPMQEWLDRTGYGNRKIGEHVDTFWLKGPLEISAVEQIEFLSRLRGDQLSFSRRTTDLVKQIVPVEKVPGGGVLRGKTGWTGDLRPAIGWYVGWMDVEGGSVVFATNIDIAKNKDAAARIPVTIEVLRTLGHVPLDTRAPRE
jgi:beta-lactamase class D